VVLARSNAPTTELGRAGEVELGRKYRIRPKAPGVLFSFIPFLFFFILFSFLFLNLNLNFKFVVNLYSNF
jgi:hypothetical protein